jgi:hypothetical protein
MLKRVMLLPWIILGLLLVACEGTVNEAASGAIVGKIEESALGPGKTVQATLDFSPGNYVLICNVPGHYKQGMYSAFRVTSGDGVREAGINVEIGEWFVRPGIPSAAAGPIRLEVTNKGKSGHNLVVIKTDLAPGALVGG